MFIEKFKYTVIGKHKNLKSKNHQPTLSHKVTWCTPNHQQDSNSQL
jgi:hypothetical protein